MNKDCLYLVLYLVYLALYLVYLVLYLVYLVLYLVYLKNVRTLDLEDTFLVVRSFIHSYFNIYSPLTLYKQTLPLCSKT